MNATDQSETTVELAEVPPPSLFFGLLEQRFTGTLELEQREPGPARRRVKFRGGMPTWTDWEQEGSRLGELALAQSLVSRAAVDAAAAKVGKGRCIGQILVDDGALPADRLVPLLRSQCARRLLDLFALREGVVHLRAGGEDDSTLLPTNVLELIHRGVTSRYDHARVRRDLGPSWTARFRATPALARYIEQFKFRNEDGSILAFLSSGAEANITELAALPESSETRAAQLVGILWHCQMIEVIASKGSFADDLAALERRIAAGQDPIAIIGVDSDATAAEIDGAWLQLATRFDPRNVEEDDADLRARVGQVARSLSALRDAARGRRLAIVEISGLRLISEAKHPRGLALLEEAITLGAKNAEIDCAIVWARLHTQGRSDVELRKADLALERTLAEHAGVAAGHYYRGCVLGWLGRATESATSLRRALELDPRLIDAERQLRAVSRPERAADQERPKKTPDVAPLPIGTPSAPRHYLLSRGYVRLYWIASVLLVIMIAANLVLRLDADF